jgi:hypothetical protein
MYAQAEKPKENKGMAIANSVTQKKGRVKQRFGFVDSWLETRATQMVVQMKSLAPTFYYGERDKRAEYMHCNVSKKFPKTENEAGAYRRKLPYYCTVDELNNGTFGGDSPVLVVLYMQKKGNIDIAEGDDKELTDNEKNLEVHERKYYEWVMENGEPDKLGAPEEYLQTLCPMALDYLKKEGKNVVFTDSFVVKPHKLGKNDKLNSSITDKERIRILEGGFMSKKQIIEEQIQLQKEMDESNDTKKYALSPVKDTIFSCVDEGIEPTVIRDGNGELPEAINLNKSADFYHQQFLEMQERDLRRELRRDTENEF